MIIEMNHLIIKYFYQGNFFHFIPNPDELESLEI